MKVKPNLFIVGAAKSGTTSLYRYLSQHPDIYFSPIKEPNYFSADIDSSKFSATYRRNTFLEVDKYFRQKTLPELHLTFVRNDDYYNRLFEQGVNNKILGEASTSYLFSKVAAQNIYEFNPESKIIVILRNPMERAFSHYQMAVRHGHTKLSLKQAIEKDYKQREKGWGISELFIELGLYYSQLKRYFEVFPEEQVKVLFFDGLKSAPQEIVSDCCNFLEIENYNLGDTTVFNVKESPGNVKFNYFITQTGIKSFLRKLIPEATKDKVSQTFYKESKTKLNRKDFNFLLEYYREDINKTASLLNKGLSHWLKYNEV